MFPSDPEKFALIRDQGGLQVFRNIETGEEFSSTVSAPPPIAPPGERCARLICELSPTEKLPKQITMVLGIVNPSGVVDLGALLREARSTGQIVFPEMWTWRAKEFADQLSKSGFVAKVEPSQR